MTNTLLKIVKVDQPMFNSWKKLFICLSHLMQTLREQTHLKLNSHVGLRLVLQIISALATGPDPTMASLSLITSYFPYSLSSSALQWKAGQLYSTM